MYTRAQLVLIIIHCRCFPPIDNIFNNVIMSRPWLQQSRVNWLQAKNARKSVLSKQGKLGTALQKWQQQHPLLIRELDLLRKSLKSWPRSKTFLKNKKRRKVTFAIPSPSPSAPVSPTIKTRSQNISAAQKLKNLTPTSIKEDFCIAEKNSYIQFEDQIIDQFNLKVCLSNNISNIQFAIMFLNLIRILYSAPSAVQIN